jgi:uncharacterized membrane protein YccF (DUF307 family)
MRAIGNFLWFILGGALMGLCWWLIGCLAFISIVGIPWGRACFVIGNFTFFPFGKEAINRKELYGKEDVGTGGFGTLGNIIWFICAGFWLALAHVGVCVLCFITIIGIPFGIQHLKLAGISLAPIGKTIVTKEVAVAARRTKAEEKTFEPV